MIRAGQTERRGDRLDAVALGDAAQQGERQEHGVVLAGGYEYAMIRKPHRDRVTVYQAPLAVAS